MSRVYVQPPVPRYALHLYRHLLREASYLPPACRPFFSERITARFHKHRREPDPTARLRQASHGLRYLRAANAGDMTRMRRVLFLAFGRIGRRRRELLGRLVKKEPPTDTAALQEMIRAATPAEPDDWLAKWDVKKLQAFLVAQAQSGIQSSPRPMLKVTQTDPAKKVPTENAFGLPLHPKPARTKLKKAWKRIIDRVLPPVAEGEWSLLRDLASGKVTGPEWEIPTRRPIARPNYKTAGRQEQAWNWTPYVTQPIRYVERTNARSMKLMAGAADANGSLPGSQPAKLHNYTSRFWRRLYAQVWQLTATVKKKPSGGGWDVKWGGTRLSLSAPAAVHGEFFQGISKDGTLPQTPVERQKKSAPRPR